MPLAVGTVIAGYRIEGVLGAGGMGTVYLARHPTLPRSDALKVLSAELSLDEQFRIRFIREADLAATLSHPNIVTVFDRGTTGDGQLWIAMQYVPGTAADELSRANLTPTRVVRIITDVAHALDYAHSRRVLHRDIKPSNFLLTEPDSAGHQRVLLADFGIARALDEATTITATGSMVFTAAYAAPEAIQGGPVDQRADVYSLGCSLFRLVTGQTPYEEYRELPAVLMAHLMQPVPRPSQVVAGLPPGMDEVIGRALAKNPADRFSTAGELAAATAAVLSHATYQPAPVARSQTKSWSTPPLSYPTTTPPRPAHQGPAPGSHPPPIGGPPPRFAGPPVAGPSGGWGPPPAPPGRRARRRRRLMLGALAAAVIVGIATAVGFYVSGKGEQPDSAAPYKPQVLTGKFGAVHLEHRPLAVAAVGPGDPDAVLSLGVQPVAIGGAGGQLPGWLHTMVHSSAPVLPALDPAALAATKPDLIIDTGDIDKASYDKLTAIAPTLSRPPDADQNWTWQSQLGWIATALGRSQSASSLVNDAASQQTAIRAQHPAFNGKTIVVINYSDTATTVPASGTASSNYLEGLGFRYDTAFKRQTGDPPDMPLDLDKSFFRVVSTDVMIVLRTDQAAGGGGYAGLPAPFGGYLGKLIIVDDPATIYALTMGGPAATAQLNDVLVTKLSRVVH